jgi:C-terminal of Roc, COR, domain
VEDILVVSCRTRRGISELKKVLRKAARAHPLLGMKVPKSYLKLQEMIVQRRIKENYISLENFQEAATKLAIPKGREVRVLEFFHDVGLICHFNDDTNDLRNLVVINPQWLVNVMSSVITFTHNFVRNGVLDHKHLSTIWKGYDERMHATLLRLLQKFEVAYPYPDKEGRPVGFVASSSSSSGSDVLGLLVIPQDFLLSLEHRHSLFFCFTSTISSPLCVWFTTLLVAGVFLVIVPFHPARTCVMVRASLLVSSFIFFFLAEYRPVSSSRRQTLGVDQASLAWQSSCWHSTMWSRISVRICMFRSRLCVCVCVCVVFLFLFLFVDFLPSLSLTWCLVCVCAFCSLVGLFLLLRVGPVGFLQSVNHAHYLCSRH